MSVKRQFEIEHARRVLKEPCHFCGGTHVELWYDPAMVEWMRPFQAQQEVRDERQEHHRAETDRRAEQKRRSRSSPFAAGMYADRNRRMAQSVPNGRIPPCVRDPQRVGRRPNPNPPRPLHHGRRGCVNAASIVTTAGFTISVMAPTFNA